MRLFVFFNLCIQIHATSCDQQMCLCIYGIVSCVGVNFPNFYYRPYITILYFENVQVDNMKDIMSAFLNLHYITLTNMIYFNCIWLTEIPPQSLWLLICVWKLHLLRLLLKLKLQKARPRVSFFYLHFFCVLSFNAVT